MRIIFTKRCFFNRHKRIVGNITTVNQSIADSLIEKGLAQSYKGVYPPGIGRKNKTKINLKDLK